jgi:hypothetical protein
MSVLSHKSCCKVALTFHFVRTYPTSLSPDITTHPNLEPRKLIDYHTITAYTVARNIPEFQITYACNLLLPVTPGKLQAAASVADQPRMTRQDVRYMPGKTPYNADRDTGAL